MMALRPRRLWLDCDGVQANFDKYADHLLGMPSRDFEQLHGSEKFWASLHDADPEFFLNLELMDDFGRLFAAVQHLDPYTLTGAPLLVPDAWWQKPIWVRNRVDADMKVVVCQSKNKAMFCQPGDIIIDDYPKHRAKWEAAGGIWIHHDDAEITIAILKDMGVI